MADCREEGLTSVVEVEGPVVALPRWTEIWQTDLERAEIGWVAEGQLIALVRSDNSYTDPDRKRISQQRVVTDTLKELEVDVVPFDQTGLDPEGGFDQGLSYVSVNNLPRILKDLQGKGRLEQETAVWKPELEKVVPMVHLLKDGLAEGTRQFLVDLANTEEARRVGLSIQNIIESQLGGYETDMGAIEFFTRIAERGILTPAVLLNLRKTYGFCFEEDRIVGKLVEDGGAMLEVWGGRSVSGAITRRREALECMAKLVAGGLVKGNGSALE